MPTSPALPQSPTPPTESRTPTVRTALRSPALLRTEVRAGLVVALALIPEAISFSIIAGVDPRVGLFAAFTMAVSIAFLGGRPAMISAATGAIALVIAPVVRDHGLDYLVATVLLGGVIQILLGVAGVARLMRFVPRSEILQPAGHHRQRHQGAAEERSHADAHHAQPPGFGHIKCQAGERPIKEEDDPLPKHERDEKCSPCRRAGWQVHPKNQPGEKEEGQPLNHEDCQFGEALDHEAQLQIQRANQFHGDLPVADHETKEEDRSRLHQRREQARQEDVGDRLGKCQAAERGRTCIYRPPKIYKHEHGDEGDHKIRPDPHVIGQARLGRDGSNGAVYGNAAPQGLNHGACTSLRAPL